MKTKRAFRPLVNLVIAQTLMAASLVPAATLSLVEKGIQLDAGDMGVFTIFGPALKDKAGKTVPLASRTATGAAVKLKFLDDTEIEVALDKDSIVFRFPKRSADSTKLEVNTTIPFRYRSGGKAGFDGQPAIFPADFGGQFIWKGHAERFELSSPEGRSLVVEVPKNWQQLQDNRAFNDNPSFEWRYIYDFSRYPSRTDFTLRIVDKTPFVPGAKRTVLADAYGQAALKDFPGKVKADRELRDDIAKDDAYYGAMKPQQRDAFGGLTGSGASLKLSKTGFFHIGTNGGRPVLVDPEGNLFFHMGVCGLGGPSSSFTYIEGRRDLFEWLPPAQGQFALAFRDGGTAFSFYAANWIRKYGKAWNAEEFTGQTVARLRALGFNSHGAFSSLTAKAAELRFPSVEFLPFTGMTTVPDTKDIVDPFADGAAEKLNQLFAQKVAPSNTDPLLIGHFLGNEQYFENIPKIVPGLRADSAAKRRLVRLLEEKYREIAKFNAAWEPKVPAGSFSELAEARLVPTTVAANDDLNAYHEIFLEAYYDLIKTAYRRHCPNHLLLGNRWLPSTARSDLVCKVAGRHLDVLSINYYTYGIDGAFLRRIHDLGGGKPLLLSEWHFGTTGQGLDTLKELKTQKERGLAYRNYVEQAAALGFVIGHQWFSYLDQPVTGRWFEKDQGEKFNTGLVNVADRPYTDFLNEVVKTNHDIYAVLLGQRTPFAFSDPRFDNTSGRRTKSLTIPRALAGMTINGVLDKWPGVPAEPITGPGLSADMRLCWDDTNLYVLVQVKDPTPMVNEQKPETLWAADSIEIFTGPAELDKPGAMLPTDRLVFLAARAGEPRWSFYKLPAQPGCQIVTVKHAASDGYTLEAAIPFAALGFTPAENQELLLDLGINDATQGRREVLWNGNSRNAADRSQWGRAKLVK